jgi:outer membrane protein assembly factor BamE (lipoprotein component of BamABCDE complex)
MLKRILAGLLSGLMTVSLPACDGINLNKLKPGVSTLDDVRAIMGPPTMEWTDADGTQTWEYARTPNGIVNYMIDFDRGKILLEVRQVLSEANFARVSPGMTREEVRRLLGRPAHEEYFALKKEFVWDWKTRTEGGYHYFFDVYFDESGHVTRTGQHTLPTSGG